MNRIQSSNDVSCHVFKLLVMEDIHTRYKSATRLLLEIRDQLEQLETGENTSDIFESRIAANINDLSRITAQLEGLVGQQTAAQRDIWKMFVN